MNAGVNMAIKATILLIIIAYLCLIIGLYILQRKLIFFPDTSIPNTSLYGNYDINEITVQTEDKLVLKGWMHSAEPNKPTIIFFHGNAGHYGHRIYNVESYVKAGFGVILVGYRGYGGNAGTPSEEGFYKDAHAYISQAIKDGVNEENIILYGQSIGTGVAVQMATKFRNIKALILEAPYTSLPDVAAEIYSFIPVRTLMKDKFDSLSKIKDVTAPLLIIQGLKDQVIPPAFGQTLYEEAETTKHIYQLKNHGHNDLPFDLLSSKVIEFVTDK